MTAQRQNTSSDTPSTIKEVLNHLKLELDKAVGHTAHEFRSLHTGRASPAMVETVLVHAYGGTVKLKEMAAITTPDAKTIVVQPWDKQSVKEIEKAILIANLGFAPSVDGGLIRCKIPPLSEERRRELIKVAHGMAEEGRIGIRAARQDSMHHLKLLENDGHVSEDEIERAKKDIQKQIDQANKGIEEALAHKEKELLNRG